MKGWFRRKARAAAFDGDTTQPLAPLDPALLEPEAAGNDEYCAVRTVGGAGLVTVATRLAPGTQVLVTLHRLDMGGHADGGL